jgi:hypothetical protein
MRIRLPLFAAAFALAASALLGGCSGGGLQASTPALPRSQTSTSRALSDILRSGVAPKSLSMVRFGQAQRSPRPLRKQTLRDDLIVDDWGLNAAEIFANTTWTNTGSISDDTDGPDGNWLDKHGLYIANWETPSITQYNRAGKLTFTYNSGMTDAVDVTTDAHGNVYEADYNYPNYSGFVNEYAQGSNTVMATCSPGGAVEGVAVSKKGAVFVYYNAGGAGYITEYEHGLGGCKGKTLGVTFSFAGGLVLDDQDNLIVCDQSTTTADGSVDIVKPPYTSISGTIGSNFIDPFHVTINKQNNLVYVADFYAYDVQVLDYPSGTNVTTLGSSNGLENPVAAVDTSNYVP